MHQSQVRNTAWANQLSEFLIGVLYRDGKKKTTAKKNFYAIPRNLSQKTMGPVRSRPPLPPFSVCRPSCFWENRPGNLVPGGCVILSAIRYWCMLLLNVPHYSQVLCSERSSGCTSKGGLITTKEKCHSPEEFLPLRKCPSLLWSAATRAWCAACSPL